MRPIDADKLLEYEIVLDENMGLKMVASQFITAAPTLDVAPVVHGEWVILVDEGDLFDHIHCTNCDFYWSNERHSKIFKYCPNCGAKMDGEEERE